VEEGRYLLKRQTGPHNEGLVDWLLACPEKGWFQPLEAESSITVPVTSPAPESLTLRQPILVVVPPEGDEFSATFFDATINATGDTQTEAVDNLKDILA
jgi:hypothetical protein